jgi:hypothetical protein
VRPGDRTLRDLALWATALLAIASLPRESFPIGWLVALTTPALALWFLLERARLRLPPAIVAGAFLQLAAITLATHQLEPLTRQCGLGGTLLPPLSFLVARRRGSDVLRGLFLAFCVFLIGAILDGPSGIECLAFVALGTVVLQLDVATRAGAGRASWRSGAPRLLPRLRSLASVAGLVLAACLLVFQVLAVLPAPGRDDSKSTRGDRDRAARAGISTDFDFENAPGSPISLQADELVRVHALDGRPVPDDLYLRCLHFDVADLDAWLTTPPADLQRIRANGISTLRRPIERQPQRHLQIEVVAPSATLLYVPPGAVTIDVAEFVGSPRTELYRLPTAPPIPFSYRVRFQDLRGPSFGALPDPRENALTAVSRDIEQWRSVFDMLLDDASVRREVAPGALAAALTDALHRRCRYALREPGGPYPHSLLNFLNGDREGFCMHFASATAICLRLAGVPCRIGVGLYGGEVSAEQPGQAIFGSHHAHAWVEIRYEDFGWVVFDPTPPLGPGDERGWPNRELPPELADALDADRDGSAGLARAIELLARPAAYPAFWLGLAGIALLTTFSRRRRSTSGPAAANVRPEAVSARRLLATILRELARLGHPRPRGHGLARYVATFAARTDLPIDDLRRAVDAYLEVRFGGRSFDAERQSRLEIALASLRACAKEDPQAADADRAT